jgi:predicted NAD-dependent protein-ADP-ribosyltransferase YbiA (DUF1768 family)
MKIPDSFFPWPGTIDPKTTQVLPFTKIREPWGWLGNMSDHPVIFQGRKFPTSEHLFQSMRLKNPQDIPLLCEPGSPMSCKMKMKYLLKSNPDCVKWKPRSREDLECMFEVIRLKIEQHRFIPRELERLHPNTVIIEDSSKRNGESSTFWGMKFDGQVWTGENYLGRIWMSFFKKTHRDDKVKTTHLENRTLLSV